MPIAIHWRIGKIFIQRINISLFYILRAGHAQLACGEMVRLDHSMNQEPTEVTQAKVA